MTGVLIRGRMHEDRDPGRRPGEDGGRDWSDLSTSQGAPRIASCYQKLGERHETDSPLQPSEGTHPADTLILDFQPPGLRDSKFLF